jgi:N-methylhydantoinase A
VSSTTRLGIDIGGTFTDAMLVDADGRLHSFKVPSTPADPGEGFMHAVDRARDVVAFDRHELAQLSHATTVATNAIFEGKGARVALVVTRGFRDMLEIARQIRPELYDLDRHKPPALVPRDRCLEVDERLGPDGEIVVALDEASVERAAQELASSDVEAVVICLLHAYANPEHERRVADILRRHLDPGVDVSCSSQVWPEFREYQRASTTIINAAIRPIVRRYLSTVEAELDRRDLDRSFYIMRCGGGIMTAAAAKQAPIHLIESGPAAGLIAAAHLGATLGWRNVITLDIGGTTAKAGLVIDGEPATTSEYEVGALATSGIGRKRGSGYPIRIPVLDLVEIGAGGGSVAWIDSGGALRVGPDSAGSVPGPACYGHGGTAPTLTDANLALGRIDPGRFLGGDMLLDEEPALAAIARDISEPLGMSVTEAAEGIVEIANASMTRLINLISVERGYDPGEFLLIAFGGAGPLHATALAAEVGIPRVVVPPHAGVLSALGLLVADIQVVSAATDITRLSTLTTDTMAARFGELAAGATAELESQGVTPGSIVLRRVAELRFRGQSYELPVALEELDAGDEVAALRRAFLEAHTRAYGYAAEDQEIELVNWKVVGTSAVPKPQIVAPTRDRAGGAEPIGTRDGLVSGRLARIPVYDRLALGVGAEFAGPAIVAEPTATTYVEAGWRGGVDDATNLVLERDTA